jgi:hypothetical protein
VHISRTHTHTHITHTHTHTHTIHTHTHIHTIIFTLINFFVFFKASIPPASFHVFQSNLTPIITAVGATITDFAAVAVTDTVPATITTIVDDANTTAAAATTTTTIDNITGVNTTTTTPNLFLLPNNKNCKKKYTLDEQDYSPALTNQLIQLEQYWTQPNNLSRKNTTVNQVTHNKRKERILCFMGWCKELGGVQQPDFTLFDISALEENKKRYEQYLDYLKNKRKLNDGTMVEHFTAAVYALKYFFAKYGFFFYFNIKYKF